MVVISSNYNAGPVVARQERYAHACVKRDKS